ncbi:MAG: acyltransferase [Prevotellaceae bacterium]|jgi:maltose O-acetyltransferase|nr:acyltransferase [Prevotellaceae bacterium]
MKFIKKILRKIRGEQNIEKLKKRGLKIGKNVTIMDGVIIDPSHCWHVEIGDNVILAPKVHILAHDASTKIFLNHTRVANVKIGSNVFIGAGTIVLPNVAIGDNAVIGAGSVVSKDIPVNSVAVGAPAKVICTLDQYLEKQKAKMNDENVFSAEFTLRNNNFVLSHREKMLESCKKYKEIFVE